MSVATAEAKAVVCGLKTGTSQPSEIQFIWPSFNVLRSTISYIEYETLLRHHVEYPILKPHIPMIV